MLISLVGIQRWLQKWKVICNPCLCRLQSVMMRRWHHVYWLCRQSTFYSTAFWEQSGVHRINLEIWIRKSSLGAGGGVLSLSALRWIHTVKLANVVAATVATPVAVYIVLQCDNRQYRPVSVRRNQVHLSRSLTTGPRYTPADQSTNTETRLGRQTISPQVCNTSSRHIEQRHTSTVKQTASVNQSIATLTRLYRVLS